MPRHMLKLIVLLASFSVTPAVAGDCGGHCRAAAQPRPHHSACPYQQAREAAAAAAVSSEPAAAPAPTRIILIERVPAGSPLGAPSGRFTP